MKFARALRLSIVAAQPGFALATPVSLAVAQTHSGAASDAAAHVDRAQPEALAPADPKRPLADTLIGDAKRDYEAALLLHESGDFAGAERRFSSAYEVTGDVRLLWNAAACEQAQRHYSKAIALVRRYLSSRSPLITEQAERDARAFLEAALPLTARLIVKADRPGSRAYVDGEPLGPLPLDADTRVDFGTHRLVVRRLGFIDAARAFTVTSSADVVLETTLDPIVHEGRLVVRAAKDAVITIDGRFRALGSFDGALPSGKHRLRVAATGSRPFETSVLIEDDRTRAVDVTLAPSPATFGLPPWVWIVGGAAVLAGAGAATYFIARPTENDGLPSGSAGKVQLPLR